MEWGEKKYYRSNNYSEKSMLDKILGIHFPHFLEKNYVHRFYVFRNFTSEYYSKVVLKWELGFFTPFLDSI